MSESNSSEKSLHTLIVAALARYERDQSHNDKTSAYNKALVDLKKGGWSNVNPDFLSMVISNYDGEVTEELKSSLMDIINEHNMLYLSGKPQITDAEYDRLIGVIHKRIAHAGPALSDGHHASSLNVRLSPSTKTYKHSVPMLSLEKVYSREELVIFLTKIKNFLHHDITLDFVGEPKIDGMAFAAIYQDGKYFKGVTRGNGYEGEELTAHIKNVEGIPDTIACDGTFEVRGEIYMEHGDFARINAKLPKPFSTPRNLVAGSFRLLDPTLIKARRLTYFAYSVIKCSKEATHMESLNYLKNLGFRVNDEVAHLCSIDLIENYFQRMEAARIDLPYDTDGIVIKLNDMGLQGRLGSTHDHPRWAVAYKYTNEQRSTIVKDITLQIGRTGAITPVAELQPVEIGGVMISRATLHNFEDMAKKSICIGDLVIVERAGDVIPRVAGVLQSNGGKKVGMPDNCPCCGHKLTKKEDDAVLRCINPNCPAQLLEKLVHFASRQALDIMGLGKRQLEKLFSTGIVKHPSDIFLLTVKSFVDMPGWGKKSIANILASIEKSKSVTLERFIFALGIRHVGQDTAKILAHRFLNLDNLINAALRQSSFDIADDSLSVIGGIDKIGHVITESIVEFFGNTDNLCEIRKLQDILNIASYRQPTIKDNPLKDKIVVFTGKLANISRDEAKSMAEAIGAHIASNVSNKTDYVVLGENAGSKRKKAEELGIKILNEQEFMIILGKKI